MDVILTEVENGKSKFIFPSLPEEVILLSYAAMVAVFSLRFFIMWNLQVLNSSPYNPSLFVKMWYIKVTFLSAEYPETLLKTTLPVDSIDHADKARQNWMYALIRPACNVLLKSLNSTVPFEKKL